MKLYYRIICPECGEPMTDANEGKYRIRYGEPYWKCENSDCPNSDNYIPPTDEGEE